MSRVQRGSGDAPRRVLVAGASGSGKTTLAARLGEVLDVPHHEIDALFHGPHWSPRPSFVRDVDAVSLGDRWVTEWQYDAVRDLLAGRADLLVWLDLPRLCVLGQLTARTVGRRLRREVLWNGNREPALWTVLRDPEHVVRWGWRDHPHSADRVARLQERRPDLPVVRLTSHGQARDWLEDLRRRQGC